MSNLIKILIPYSFYDKSYIEETDTAIYTLKIINNFWNIEIKIKIKDYCDINKAFTSLEIMSNNVCQFYHELGESSQMIAINIAQDFLKMNDLLMYIKGFGTPSFNKNIYLEQNKPTTENYESNNNCKDR